MNLSSPVPAAPASTHHSEPPLSPISTPTAMSEPLTPISEPAPPAAVPAPEPVSLPEPAVVDLAAAVPPPSPVGVPAQATSLESLLLRMGLVTADQIAIAMREEAETGAQLEHIVVGKGWVTPEDLVKIHELRDGTRQPTLRTASPPPPVVVAEQPAPVVQPVAPQPVVEATHEPVVVEPVAPIAEPLLAAEPVADVPSPSAEPAAPVVEPIAASEPLDASEPLAGLLIAPEPVVTDSEPVAEEPVVAPPELIVAPEPVAELAPEPVATVLAEVVPDVVHEPVVEAAPEPVAPPAMPEMVEPITVPEPVAVSPEPEPAPLPEPTVEPESASRLIESKPVAALFVRLENGERIEVGEFDTEADADAQAHLLMAEFSSGGDWPRVSSRYIRPEAVISIDLDLTGF